MNRFCIIVWDDGDTISSPQRVVTAGSGPLEVAWLECCSLIGKRKDKPTVFNSPQEARSIIRRHAGYCNSLKDPEIQSPAKHMQVVELDMPEGDGDR